jgi:hypothetical protein
MTLGALPVFHFSSPWLHLHKGCGADAGRGLKQCRDHFDNVHSATSRIARVCSQETHPMDLKTIHRATNTEYLDICNQAELQCSELHAPSLDFELAADTKHARTCVLLCLGCPVLPHVQVLWLGPPPLRSSKRD